MRKSFYLLLTVILSCSGIAQAKFVKFEAKIANRNSDFINISNIRGLKFEKTIKINKEGVFKDTIKVVDGMYRLYDGKESTELFLKNGFDINLNMDAKQFDETIVCKGKGALENNLLARRILEDEKYYDGSIFKGTEDDFKKKLDEKNLGDVERLKDIKLDPLFVSEEKITTDENFKMLQENYISEKKKNEFNSKFTNVMSPSFDYENHKGEKTKLEDFKGKYVYIDVWATWCGPCRAEIPALKAVEDKYKDKNIVFVSISVDLDKDHQKWKTLVSEKKLGGVQLIADKNWNSDFVTNLSSINNLLKKRQKTVRLIW